MRTVRPNWWFGLALLFAQVPAAEAAPTKGTSTAGNPSAAAKTPSTPQFKSNNAATKPNGGTGTTSPNATASTSSTASAKKTATPSAVSSPLKPTKAEVDEKNAAKAKPAPPT